MAFKYQIENLKILSDLEIPMLRISHFEKADLRILVKENIKTPKETIETHDKYILYKDTYQNIFSINKKEIQVFIKHQKYKKEAAITIMGIPIGYLLQNNGFQVLHGSSVAHNNSGVSFIGMSGAGKSSIGLSLVNDGFKLVTEDLCIVKNKNIFNFSNWIKSTQSAIPERVIYSNKILIKKDSRGRSLFKVIDEHISRPKIKLRAIYILIDANDTQITELKASDAFKYLFTYAYRINDQDKESFRNLSELCNNTKCYLFSRDLNKSLQKNKNFLLDHLNRDSALL